MLGNCNWIVQSSHDRLEFVERAEAQLVSPVDEGVYQRKPGFHLLWVSLVVGYELRMASEGGCTGHEEVAGCISWQLPWAYLSPLTTL